MGQGISCNNEDQIKADINNKYASPIKHRTIQNEQSIQDQKGLINQFNNISLISSHNQFHKDAYDNDIYLQRTPSSLTINSEQKQTITDEINPLTNQTFHRQDMMKNGQDYQGISRKHSREVISEIITAPSSTRKLQRPSSNCKLTTRVQEKLLDKDDDDENLALNFSPSKSCTSSKAQDKAVLQDINYQSRRLDKDSRNTSSQYSLHHYTNSNDTGFRYLQSGINQLQNDQHIRVSYDQSIKESFGINKPPLTYQQNVQYKQQKLKYNPIEDENKCSKRYNDKENMCEEELFTYDYKINQRNQMLSNLEQFKKVSNKPQDVVLTTNNQIEKQKNFDIYKIQEEEQQKYSRNQILVQNRTKSVKRNEISTNQRTVPTSKQFKEDEVIKKKLKSKKQKNNKRHYSSSQSSSSSSPSLSSHDSYQNSSEKDKRKQKKHKSVKSGHKPADKQDKQKHISSKKQVEQPQNVGHTGSNEESNQCCTVPHQQQNSTQLQCHSHHTQHTEEMQRISSRSTITPHSQHANSQCLQASISQNQKYCSNQHCQNSQCIQSNKEIQSTNSCLSCANHTQIIGSHSNNHQQLHTCQNKVHPSQSTYESNNLINRNQSNLSMCQINNNNSNNNNNSLLINNQFGQFNNPQSQQISQYSSTQQHIHQIQQQLIQQQLALAQTQQTHQSHIQNLLMQQQQQQQQSAMPMIPPYNLLYTQPNISPHLQNHITQSHIIGNYTNHQLATPVGKQNAIMPIYYPAGQTYMPPHPQNSTTVQNQHEFDYLISDKNQMNIYNQQHQQLNSAYPQLSANQYLLHPSLQNNSQPFPIIINNNVLSPKRQKDQIGVNGNKNISKNNEISDDKLKNMQSLSFNINSSLSDENNPQGKKKKKDKNQMNQDQDQDNMNKILETSISEQDGQSKNINNNKQKAQMELKQSMGQNLKKNNLFSRDDNEDFINDDDNDDYVDKDTDEIDSHKIGGYFNDTNANKPLSKTTRNNINNLETRGNNHKSRETSTFRNNNQQKNKSHQSQNFDELIRNTNIESSNNQQAAESLQLEINFQSNTNKNQQKSLAEIFQEKRKKLAQKMDDQKKGISQVKVEEKISQQQDQNENEMLVDDFAQANSTYQTKQQGKRSKNDIIKLRQEMKDYGNSVNPKLKAKTQQKQQAEQVQINQDIINGTARMKSPVYSKQKEEMMIRLAQGIKPKISEKEMYALTKKNYENLPEVKKRKQEQEKQNNKQELLKIKQDKLKELDEKRRGKYKQKNSVQNLNTTKVQMINESGSQINNYNSISVSSINNNNESMNRINNYIGNNSNQVISYSSNQISNYSSNQLNNLNTNPVNNYNLNQVNNYNANLINTFSANMINNYNVQQITK